MVKLTKQNETSITIQENTSMSLYTKYTLWTYIRNLKHKTIAMRLISTNPRQRRHFVGAVQRQATKDLEIFIWELSCPQRLVRRTAVRLSRVLSFMIWVRKGKCGKSK